MIDRMYQARRPSRTEFVPVRHLNYHVRQWGQPDAAQALQHHLHQTGVVRALFGDMGLIRQRPPRP